MPLLLIVIGLTVLAAVVNDRLGELGALARKDLFGDGDKPGFVLWGAAILLVGGIFRAVDLPDAGRALVVLVIVAFLLAHADVPSVFLNALRAAGKGDTGGAGAGTGGGNTGGTGASTGGTAAPASGAGSGSASPSGNAAPPAWNGPGQSFEV